MRTGNLVRLDSTSRKWLCAFAGRYSTASITALRSERKFPVLPEIYLVAWALVKEGLGIGIQDGFVGDTEPLVQRVVAGSQAADVYELAGDAPRGEHQPSN